MKRAIIRNLIAAACLGFVVVAPAMADDVVIQWASNNANVRLQTGYLVADRGQGQPARFEVVRLEGRRIALRAQDGTYVRAGVGRQTLLATGSPHIRGWETFELDGHGGNTYSLRSIQNGKFVELDRTGRLAATADIRGTHAQLRLLPVADRPATLNPIRPSVMWAGAWRNVWVYTPEGRRLSAPPASPLRFDIAAALSVSSSAGCNIVTSQLTIRGNRASFAPPMMTRRSCRNPQERFEQLIARAMTATQGWEFREGQIVFLNRAGQPVLQIAR